MAQPAQTPELSGADRIRSLKDEGSIFQAFDAYPWTKDKMFLSGLSAILGSPNADNPQGSPADMAIHARIFYYAQRIGVKIDFARYQDWLAKHPNHQPPQVLPEEYLSRGDGAATGSGSGQQAEDVLPWQHAAPKADLFIDRQAAAEANAAAGAGGGEPTYPMGFAEMLKLLQEGKEIPGIRQIPNTIARDPTVKPVGSRAAPRKPWERDSAPQAPEMNIPNALDTEFPPLDTDTPSSSSAEPVPA